MNRSFLGLAVCTLAFSASSLIACSSSSTPDTSTETGPDTSTTETATEAAVEAAPMDMAIPETTAEAAPSSVNGCDTFEDHTAAGDARAIVWGLSVNSTPAHCMKIKAGQTVVWNGDTGGHPLVVFNGDTPNPISGVVADVAANTQTVTFPSAGTFGYECNVHKSGMMGAIQVVP